MTEATKNRPTHQAAILDWIASRPQGATVLETRAQFDRASHSVSCSLARLLVLGLIGWVDVPNPSTARAAKKTVRRYFSREHCPPGATLAADVKPLVRAMNGGPKFSPKPTAATYATVAKPREAPLTPADEFKAAKPRITERTKVTICPAGKDHRFTPAHVPPFFAAGQRLEPRPWVAAVTGSAP